MSEWFDCKKKLPPVDVIGFSETVLCHHKTYGFSVGWYVFEDHILDDDGNLDMEESSILKNGWGYWETQDSWDLEPNYWCYLPVAPKKPFLEGKDRGSND